MTLTRGLLALRSQVRKLRIDGMAPAEIAGLVGIHRDNVYHLIEGITQAEREDRDDDIRALVGAGKSAYRIAKDLGVSYNTVRKVMKRERVLT